MGQPRIIRRGYVFRLRGNAQAEARLRRYSGCCRKAWNLALAEQQARRERGESYLNYVGMAKWLTRARPRASNSLARFSLHGMSALPDRSNT